MTTFQISPDADIADALSVVIGRLGRDRQAVAAAGELRAVASGGRPSPAAVPHGPVRSLLAAHLRQIAAEGHPAGQKLEDLAAGLDASVADRALNG